MPGAGTPALLAAKRPGLVLAHHSMGFVCAAGCVVEEILRTELAPAFPLAALTTHTPIFVVCQSPEWRLLWHPGAGSGQDTYWNQGGLSARLELALSLPLAWSLGSSSWPAGRCRWPTLGHLLSGC